MMRRTMAPPRIETLPDQKGRIIIIGDVHGCLNELDNLLTKCHFQQGTDCVVFVGDLVNKGYDSVGVVQRCIEIGAKCVMGNHDDWCFRVGKCFKNTHNPNTAEPFPDDLIAYLKNLPHVLKIPQYNLLLVHAGVLPHVPLKEQDPEDLFNMRRVTCDGKAVATEKEALWSSAEPWAKVWAGPETVVFGHDGKAGLQVEEFALGLDTACFHGGHLTAAIYEAGATKPKIVQVDGWTQNPFLSSARSGKCADGGQRPYQHLASAAKVKTGKRGNRLGWWAKTLMAPAAHVQSCSPQRDTKKVAEEAAASEKNAEEAATRQPTTPRPVPHQHVDPIPNAVDWSSTQSPSARERGWASASKQMEDEQPPSRTHKVRVLTPTAGGLVLEPSSTVATASAGAPEPPQESMIRQPTIPPQSLAWFQQQQCPAPTLPEAYVQPPPPCFPAQPQDGPHAKCGFSTHATHQPPPCHWSLTTVRDHPKPKHLNWEAKPFFLPKADGNALVAGFQAPAPPVAPMSVDL